MARTDHPAPEDAREQVRAMLAQQWQESVAVTYFRLQRTDFAVPGRSNPIARVLMVIALVILIIPLAIWLLIVELFGLESSIGPASKRGKLHVKGHRDCAAQAVGDAVNGAGPDLWLAWSHTNMAFVSTTPSPRVLWHSTGPHRPRLKATETTLTWPDGSTVSFQLADAERTRIQSHHGHP
jgi:hypothetical protein